MTMNDADSSDDSYVASAAISFTLAAMSQSQPGIGVTQEYSVVREIGIADGAPVVYGDHGG